MLLSLVGVGNLNPFTGIPLVFLVFGIWLIVAALVLPGPDDRYAPPRSMILAWGGMVTFLGAIWFVGTIALTLVPVVLLVVLVVIGIGAVGYALTRAEAKWLTVSFWMLQQARDFSLQILRMRSRTGAWLSVLI